MEWDTLAQGALRAVLAYAAVVVFVRVSGNRTLAKMRAFDFLVTVALGTLLATTIIDTSVPLSRGLTMIGLLILLQWIVARLGVQSRGFDRLVTNQSVVLYANGDHDRAAMRKARITFDEIESAIRQAGVSDRAQVREVRLETSGEMSVTRSA